MKPIVSCLILLLAGAFLAPPACRAEGGQTNSYPAQLLKFSAAKEKQVQKLAEDLKITVPPEIAEYFKAGARGDCAAVTNTFERLAPEYGASFNKPAAEVPAWVPLWQPMIEVVGAYTAFGTGGAQYPLAFGNGIIQSIPEGSIYFGGTDAGRNLVTALCTSHVDGQPFYTLTQNALSNGQYMDYLRAMYGKQIQLPTTNEVQKVIEEYKADAQLRLKQGRLKPGEDVREVDGEVQVNGQVAVMAMHGRLARLILEQNPKRDFYTEESFPLDAVYSHLSPHGLIFKLNHEPLKALTPAMLDADHAFWTKECQSMVGDWLTPETSLSNVCGFVETVYGRKDWSGFSGDKAYVTNAFATSAFSKLRVSLAGLYQWRLNNKTDADDATRLRAEADFAFRQSLALCPTSLEVIYRYLNFLVEGGRIDDAVALMETAHTLMPDNEQVESILKYAQETRKRTRATK
jgi:hypothetical protein